MERNPHLLIEGCAIALLRHRREGRLHLHPRRVLPRPGDPRGRDREGVQGRLSRQEHPRQRLRLRRLHASRRRRLRGGRGDGADRVARRQARAAAPQAAVPRGRRPLPVPDRGQQRRDALQRAAHRAERRRVVRAARSGEERRPEALLRQRPREAARRVRSVDAHDAARADLRRRVGRACATAGRSRRSSPADRRCRCCSPSSSTRRPASTRVQKAGSLLGSAGLIVLDETRLHGVAGDEPAALLPPRVVRQVHAVPRRRRLALQAAAAHRARRGADRRTSTCSSAWPTTSSARRSARSATPPRRRC